MTKQQTKILTETLGVTGVRVFQISEDKPEYSTNKERRIKSIQIFNFGSKHCTIFDVIPLPIGANWLIKADDYSVLEISMSILFEEPQLKSQSEVSIQQGYSDKAMLTIVETRITQ